MLLFALCQLANPLTFQLRTPLWWVCVVGGLAGTAVGSAVAPTTAAIIAVLPVDRMGAGSAVNNAIRQVGSVLGVALLGTVLANAYQRAIAPSLRGLPAGTRHAAGQSAEATRQVAAAIGRPELVAPADRAFIHAMHVTASVATVCVLIGAVILIAAFRNRRPSTPQEPARPVPAGVGTGARSGDPA